MIGAGVNSAARVGSIPRTDLLFFPLFASQQQAGQACQIELRDLLLDPDAVMNVLLNTPDLLIKPCLPPSSLVLLFFHLSVLLPQLLLGIDFQVTLTFRSHRRLATSTCSFAISRHCLPLHRSRRPLSALAVSGSSLRSIRGSTAFTIATASESTSILPRFLFSPHPP